MSEVKKKTAEKPKEKKNEKAKKENEEMNSIVGSFFYGKVQKDLEYPHPCFNPEQKETGKAMLDAVDKFFQDSIDSAKLDEEGKIPESIIRQLGELGLCGLAVPTEYDGMELDYSLYCRIFSGLASHDSSIATTLGAHQSIGYRAILQEGSAEQKKKWLPRLASGEVIAAFCLTEPGSGSDAYSI
ncbi:MAG: acyl-CoA dehydrogenase family protein, partial [Halobacteriovoraceae bacterium]|nr:acyl-CoA dehydrogenase family protein [Halobacteriovoraceae bacterium]